MRPGSLRAQDLVNMGKDLGLYIYDCSVAEIPAGVAQTWSWLVLLHRSTFKHATIPLSY